ncbi:MAG: (deoxy)nucleoside triphosphate pyrophosphohydrolase [Bacteroidales bacterium]|nr:(deoxy)nucleoside triphosphate pyrophosphohydrolase [Bacteroidales bacterium]
MKTIEVVAAIMTDGEQRIFATQRGYGEFKDMWEFPGGKVEAGESREDALRREIREELDTEIDVEEHLCTVDYDYPSFHLTMHCYMCSVVSGGLVLKEHEAARWLAPEELDSVDWLPADLEILPKIVRFNRMKAGLD